MDRATLARRLLAIMADIAEQTAKFEAMCEEHLANARKYGKTWTDPRNGITYSFRRRK
jgi:hypothetical protein